MQRNIKGETHRNNCIEYMNKAYLIFSKNTSIQECCTWFRYRDEALRYNKEHFENVFKVLPHEFDSLKDVDPCEPTEFTKSSRCEHCWRKIKNDYLKHIGDINMKKEENFDPNVIDDSEFEEVRKSFEEKFGEKK